jgi:hypothetical protein
MVAPHTNAGKCLRALRCETPQVPRASSILSDSDTGVPSDTLEALSLLAAAAYTCGCGGRRGRRGADLVARGADVVAPQTNAESGLRALRCYMPPIPRASRSVRFRHWGPGVF